mmetsp:Transcript_12393/g.43138  ORF Transcript_12393/g.43138 Transcript_12393/m.43138 type:complete len:588 (-) Transcript_12393:573-2336(-)
MNEAGEVVERQNQVHHNVVNKVFGYLGVCHFEHAAKLCEMKKHVINSAFSFLHWRGGRNETFCDTIVRVIGAERDLVRIVELNGQQRQDLFLTFQGTAQDISSALNKVGSTKSKMGANSANTILNAFIGDVVKILRSRSELIRVLRMLSEEDGMRDLQSLIDLLIGAEAYGWASESFSSSDPLIVNPYKERAEHENSILIKLLQGYNYVMNYDLLGSTKTLYQANALLMQVKEIVQYRNVSGQAGGRRMISEWWTQMDGYWGGNTTRALQQFLNSVRTENGQDDWDALSVDSNFGPKTISALQKFLVRERQRLTACNDDVSYRGNTPKSLNVKHSVVIVGSNKNPQQLLSLWPEIAVDGLWSKPTKTALQAFLKSKVGTMVNFNVDGRFHQRSSQALQIFLAQEGWYRPALHNLTNAHQSRVTLHVFQLHKWLCAFQEALASNVAFVFFNTFAEKAASRDIKSLSEMSQRTAVPFFHSIESFARKCEAQRVVLVLDVSENPQFHPSAYDFPSKEPEAPLGGLRSMPDVFCFPPDSNGEMKLRHWPTVASLIWESRRHHMAGLNVSLQHHFEPKLNTTYFLQLVLVNL